MVRGWFEIIEVRGIELVLSEQHLGHAQPVNCGGGSSAAQLAGGEPFDDLFEQVAGSNQRAGRGGL